MTWKDYERDVERRLEVLRGRVQSGAYRALPARRCFIPKPDGRRRPLAVAALEDKIVQRAVVALLNAIYEADFLAPSRPASRRYAATEDVATLLEGTAVYGDGHPRPASRIPGRYRGWRERAR